MKSSERFAKNRTQAPFAKVPKRLIADPGIDDTTFRILAHLEGEKDKPRDDGKPWTFSVPGVAKALEKPERTVRKKFQHLAKSGVLVQTGVLESCRQRIPVYEYRSEMATGKHLTAALETAVSGNDGGTECLHGGTNEQRRRSYMPHNKNDSTENEGTENEGTKNGKSPSPNGSSLKERFSDLLSGGVRESKAAQPRPGGGQGGSGISGNSEPAEGNCLGSVKKVDTSALTAYTPSTPSRRSSGSAVSKDKNTAETGSPANGRTAFKVPPSIQGKVEHLVQPFAMSRCGLNNTPTWKPDAINRLRQLALDECRFVDWGGIPSWSSPTEYVRDIVVKAWNSIPFEEKHNG